jgi:hypothetical protein
LATIKELKNGSFKFPYRGGYPTIDNIFILLLSTVFRYVFRVQNKLVSRYHQQKASYPPKCLFRLDTTRISKQILNKPQIRLINRAAEKELTCPSFD